MLKIGLTGGIGSGKTTVSYLFNSLGIPIYYADARSKYLLNHEQLLIEKVTDLFGVEAYNEQGLNRGYIADIVFQDKSKLTALNELVHPQVALDVLAWANQLTNGQKPPYILKEAALLFEAGSYKMMDATIVVMADKGLRISRVQKRDKVSAEKVQSRMAHQVDDATRLKLADYFIYNNEKESLIDQVMKVHRSLLTKTS